MNFELELTEEKVKPHQTTALHLIAGFAWIGLGAVTTVVTMSNALKQYIPTYASWMGPLTLAMGLLLVIITIFKNRWLIRSAVKNRTFRIIELLFTALLAMLCYVNQWNVLAGILGVITAAIVFSLFWEQEKNNKLSVYIQDDGIKLPITSRKRSLGWHEVEKVLLRHGVITIDCCDNHLYQWNVQSFSFSKEELETFCAEKIEANKDKRIEDW